MVAAFKDDFKAMSFGVLNNKKTVCENKIDINRQTCRVEHMDPHAKQLHTGTASKKSFRILCVMCARLGNTFFYVIHSVKETLDDFD